MPRDASVPAVQNLNRVFWDEEPRTKFVDWIDAIGVTMVNCSNRATVFQAMSLMQSATWGHDVVDLYDLAGRAAALGAGSGSLPLNLEVPSFTFLVGGISRIVTHQIVRTRVGVVYSQRGTGDQDCRHDDVLVPRSLNRPGAEAALDYYVDVVLAAKNFYAYSVDKREHSLVAMRYALPQSLAQYIFVHVNLMALMGLVGKRLCTVETLEYNVVARKMVEEVTRFFPEFGPYLKADCEKPGGCHYQRGFGKSLAGSVYAPDRLHDVGPWNPASYVYDRTRDEMLDGPPFPARRYVGFRRVP